MPDTSTSTMEAAENELQKILVLRFNTAFERRMETFKHEMQAAEDEFRLAGALHSGAFVKEILELRCKAVRDIVLGVLHSAKEVRSKHGLSWTGDSLNGTAKNLEELIEGQFSGQKNAVQEQLSRSYKPNDSVMEWALRELEKETSKLSAEIVREIDALRSELKIQAITGGRDPQQARTVQINISGGQIGVLNVAGIIDAIEQNLSIVNEAGNKEAAEAIKCLAEAVMASNDLKGNQVRQALEHLEFLSSQPALPPERRSKSGVVSAVLSSFRQLISTAADLSQIWSTWGPKLEAALRSMGII